MDDDVAPPITQLRQRSIRGGTAVMAGQAIRFFLTFGSTIYLSRLLEPAQFGLIAMVTPVLGFVQVFTDFGLLQAVVQRPNVSHAQLNAVFWINLAISSGLFVVFALFAPVLAWLYHDQRLIPVAIVLSSLIVVSGCSQLQSALINRGMRFIQMTVIDVTAATLGVVVAVIAAWDGMGYWALVLNQVATAVTFAVLLWAFGKWRPSRPKAAAGVGSMLRFGGHITGANVVGYLNTSIDNMMIGAVFGQVGLGIYDRGWKLAVQPLVQLTAPIDRLALPILSRLQLDGGRYRDAYVKMLSLLCLVAMPGLLFAAINANALILLLFGTKWQDAIPVFSWVCVGALITPLNIGAFWLFTSQGRGKPQLTVTVIVSLINIAAYASGLPWGPAGVARSSALSVYLFQCPILLWAATREGPVSLRDVLQAVYPFFIALPAMGLIVFNVFRSDAIGSYFILLAELGLSYAIVACALMCLPSGRRTLHSVWGLKSAFRRQR